MFINCDNKKLQDTFNAFYQITGINVNLVDRDFSLYDCNPTMHNNYCQNFQCSESGGHACGTSDRTLLRQCRDTKQACWHLCHGGLTDIAVPILYNEEILGYIILGQLKTGDYFSDAIPNLTALHLDVEMMRQQYMQLPMVAPEKIDSLITIVTILAEHVLTKNMLTPTINQNLTRAINYIQENLHRPLIIQEIATNTNLSKSVLYRHFHSHFHCTVNEYINRERINRAVKLLIQTDLSIEEISQQVGFSSASYFGRIFKSIKGCSPLSFRKK